MINLLDNTPNQPSKFRTNNWFEINDDTRQTYNKNSQTKFKTSMLKSRLCDYSDAYILVSGTITINAKRLDERNKGIIFQNCAPFTDCISEVNNTQIDNVKDLDVMMPIYNSIEYNNNCSKISGSFW